MSSALEIRCFGNLAFRLGDAYLRIGNKKAAELLAYLLCHGGEPIPKQHLAGLLWPRVGGRQALDSLYKVCTHIGALEYRGIPLRLRSSGGEIQLDCRSISCDLFRFDALYQEKDNIASCHTLLDIYAGPLLQTQGYDWLAPWEARYELRYVEILTSLLSHYERSGDATRAGVFRKSFCCSADLTEEVFLQAGRIFSDNFPRCFRHFSRRTFYSASKVVAGAV